MFSIFFFFVQEVGYCQGMNQIAALLLMFMNDEVNLVYKFIENVFICIVLFNLNNVKIYKETLNTLSILLVNFGKHTSSFLLMFNAMKYLLKVNLLCQFEQKHLS